MSFSRVANILRQGVRVIPQLLEKRLPQNGITALAKSRLSWSRPPSPPIFAAFLPKVALIHQTKYIPRLVKEQFFPLFAPFKFASNKRPPNGKFAAFKRSIENSECMNEKFREIKKFAFHEMSKPTVNRLPSPIFKGI